MTGTTKTATNKVEIELRISLWPIFALLAVAGLLAVFASDRVILEPARIALLIFSLFCYLGAGIAWAVNGWSEQSARWILTLLVTILISVGLFWLQSPGFIALVTLPVVIATGLLGQRSAFIVAVAHSSLLVVSSGVVTGTVPAWQPAMILLSLAAIWTTLVLLAFIYRPMRQMTIWSWQQYARSQQLLVDARARSEELAQVLDELLHANRQLDLLNERLAATRLLAEEAHKAKATFVAKVSHEFRTPLNMIIGLTDLLMETPDVYGDQLPAALTEDLKIVHRNCTHLAGMVNDVLDISQAEAGRLSLRREWVDLRQDIETSIAVVQPLIEKKRLALYLNLDAELAEVYCDRTRIRQVLLNLVSNAARYTEQGSITVELTQCDQSAQVRVRDTGPGIAPADAERIFEPFFQGTLDTWRDRSGSGLGLTISRQFVELHGGKIWVESEVGRGSTFSFRLPLMPPAPPQVGSHRWLHEEWEWVERSKRPPLPRLPYRERVVVYDDSNELLQVFADTHPEIELVNADSLEHLAEIATEVPAHFVALNAADPEQLLARLAQVCDSLPDTPVVGYVLPPHLAQAVDARIFDYLIKPITRADLRKVLESVATYPQRILVVDDDVDFQQLLMRMLYVLDPALEVVTVGDGETALNILQQRPPDLIFLDLAIPNLDGWQVLAFKEERPELRAIPVTIVSAQDPVAPSGNSGMVMASIGGGIPSPKLLPCALALSTLLLGSEPTPDPTFE